MDPTSELWGGGGGLRPGTAADSTHKCSFDSVSYTVNKQRTRCPHEAHMERIKVLMCLLEKIKTWGKKINNLLHVQKPHVEMWLKSCGAQTYKNPCSIGMRGHAQAKFLLLGVPGESYVYLAVWLAEVSCPRALSCALLPSVASPVRHLKRKKNFLCLPLSPYKKTRIEKNLDCHIIKKWMWLLVLWLLLGLFACLFLRKKSCFFKDYS